MANITVYHNTIMTNKNLKEGKTTSLSELEKELKHINRTYKVSSPNLRN